MPSEPPAELPAAGLPGYLVTRDGRVFSCRKGGGWIPVRPYLCKGSLTVVLWDGPRGRSRSRSFRVAALLASTFIGPRPPGCVAIADNPGRPTADAVRWVPKGKARNVRKKPNTKITPAQVVALREAVADAVAQGRPVPWAALAKALGVCVTNCRTVASGKSWADAGGPLWVPGPPVRKPPTVSKITPETARLVKLRLANRERVKDIAEALADRGVTVDIVDSIKRGASWSRVTI